MQGPRVQVVDTVVGAWQDAFRAMAAMPAVAVTALALLLLIALGVFFAVEAFLLDRFASTLQMMASVQGFIFSLASSVAQIVLLAPLSIAVQRFTLLGEAATRYPFAPASLRHQRTIGYAILIGCLFRAPDLINLLLPDARTLPRAANIAAALAGFAAMIAVCIVGLRRLLLFPAIATDVPGASWRGARQAMLGNTWRVLAVVIGVALPGATGVAMLHWLMPVPQWPNGTGQLVLSAMMALVQLPLICALAAAAARIYRRIGAGLAVSPPGMRAGQVTA